ncbi:MAG: leucine-rich repeat domain-containing protein [Bacteroidales bacterium]|nr:leucine-rich repeat domain-containing protein [Bacteroidales bacterium]MBP3254711.1 leucine-rich repeat domain-containing protein [Bacteroidales bacterium]
MNKNQSMFKKFFLATVLLLNTLWGGVFAQILTDSENGLKYYAISGQANNCEVQKDSDKESYVIPATITVGTKTYTVTRISNFKENTVMTSITLPENLKEIWDNTFQKCSSLTSIVIPSKVKEIRANAFQNCTALSSVTFSEREESSLTLGSNAFQNTAITQITIPEGPTFLPTSLFQGCNKLTKVNIPSTAASIGTYCFYDCSALESIVVPSSVTTISDRAFTNCTSLSSVTLNEGLTKIGPNANGEVFRNCSSLTSITIPSTVEKIGQGCFRETKIETLDLSETKLTEISSHLLNGQKSVTTVKLPLTVTQIGQQAFLNCTALTTITGLNNVSDFQLEALRGCTALSSEITIEAPVKNLSERVFFSCTSLTKLFFTSETVVEGRTIKNDLVKNCSSLKEIQLPAGMTSIPESYFENCSSLTTVTLPATVTTIGNSAFKGCKSLASLTLPDGLTTIGEKTFHSAGLTTLNIPVSVTSIGYEAFYDCDDLVTVTSDERTDISTVTLEEEIFKACDKLQTVTLPEGIETLSNQMFNNCKSLVTVNMPNTLTSIGDEVFQGSTIASAVIPDGVTYIGYHAFHSCTGLKKLILSKSLETCGNEPFGACTYLEEIYLPEGLKNIPERTFYRCESLKEVDFPSTIEFIGENAFQKCGLTLLVLHSMTPPTVEDGAFSDCQIKQIKYPCTAVEAYKSFVAKIKDEYPSMKEPEQTYLVVNDISEDVYMNNHDCFKIVAADEVIIRDGGSLSFNADNEEIVNAIKSATIKVEQNLKTESWNLVGNISNNENYTFLDNNQGLTSGKAHDMAAVKWNYTKNDWGGDGDDDDDYYAKAEETFGENYTSAFVWPFAGGLLGDYSESEAANADDLNDTYTKLLHTAAKEEFNSKLEVTATNTGEYTYTLDENTIKGYWYSLYNPYFGKIKVKDFTDENAVQGNCVYVYDGGAWQMLTATDGEIKPGQGFLVASETSEDKGAAGDELNITFKPSMLKKVVAAGTETVTSKEAVNSQLITLTAQANGVKRQAFAVKSDNGKNGFDANDAYILFSSENGDMVEPYFTVDNRRLQTNVFKTLPYVCPIGFRAGKTSNVEFTIKNIPDGIDVAIVDLTTGEQTVMDNNVFSFVAQQGNNSGRYVLKFYAGEVSLPSVENAADNICIRNENHQLFITAENLQSVDITDMKGQTVMQKTVSGNHASFALDNASGVYVVRVKTSEGQKSQKIVIK